MLGTKDDFVKIDIKETYATNIPWGLNMGKILCSVLGVQ